jgi:4'-phosphopantetheinyl transferase EntD
MSPPPEQALARALFGPEVLVAASPLDGDPAALPPEERALCAGRAAKRARELATGRRCARVLLARLGWPEFALLRDDQGLPCWPPGVVGSISHTRDLCVVAVASARDVVGLGVDVERAGPLERRLWRRICTRAERDWLEGRPETERGGWAKVLFSVKEASFKAWFPGVREPAGLRRVEVALDAANGRFRAMIEARSGASRAVAGVFRRDARWVMSGATLLAGDEG